MKNLLITRCFVRGERFLPNVQQIIEEDIQENYKK